MQNNNHLENANDHQDPSFGWLTLFLRGEGGISPLIVYHVTKSVRNRVKRPKFDATTAYGPFWNRTHYFGDFPCN